MEISYNFILHRQRNKEVFDYLKEQMFWSARLYNQVLQIHNEMYWNCSVIYNYQMMEKLVKQLVVNNYFYKLKSGVAQQTIKEFYSNLESYFSDLREYKLDPKKFKGVPRPPKFKGRYNTCVYTYVCLTIEDGVIYPARNLAIKLPQDNFHDFACTHKGGKHEYNIKDVRFKYLSKNKIKVIVDYETDELNKTLDKNNFIGVDLGSRGLMTVVSKDKSFIFDGKYIGKIHRECNYQLDKLKSDRDLHKSIFRYDSNQIKELYLKRDFKISSYLHLCSKRLVEFCVKHKVQTIVMGYNPSWKESISKRTSRFQNRRFNEIPFLKLIKLLKYKCQKVGIRLITLNESFTSKCSALHLEKICKHETYQGVRYGGWFKSDKGFLNADINGAINILRRFVKDNDFVKRLISSKHIFNPKRLKLAEICCKQQYCALGFG